MISAVVVTVSDKGFAGERIDTSGKEVERLLADAGFAVSEIIIVPDEESVIAKTLLMLVDEKKIDLIVTTGGTGVSPRDVTPDATLVVIEKELPGMAEAMRFSSLQKTPFAMISRAVVGIRKKSLIINLPGSPKGARENLLVVIPALNHAIEKIKGDPTDCAS